MKTKLVLIFSFLACMYGCRQDQLLELNPQTENSQSLKLDFEQKTGYNEKDIYFLNPNFRTSIKWSRIVWKSTDTAYIKVNVLDELSYPLGDTVISLQDQVWIKAFKNSRKEWRYLLLTFIPVETKKAFSGMIISSSILSNSTKIATFSKGENIRNLDQTNVAAIEKYNRNMGSLVKMAAGKKCVYAYVNGQLNQISCTDTDEIDDGDGGIYDDPPPNPGDYYPTNPPIGGSDTGEQKEEDKVTDDLDDYPCAKNILKLLPNLKTDIAARMNQLFGGSEFNVNFNAYDFKNPNIDGKAYRGNPDAEEQQYTVSLDSTLLRNATQEYILATMYHEMIHAFFFGEAIADPQNFGLRYPTIHPYDVAGVTKYKAVQNHSDMINIMYTIKQAILSFNPNFPPEKAEALAKLGIVEINNTELQINQNEKNATQNRSGQKCPD
ncbi:hypothetical protein ACR78F_06150 [Sphingobacterium spiritivorum]|uniref:hypothetical protein n=1 Tax=Sphingobacterium spiritivorum TaxID=258 RepID=UPI003DA1F4B1